MAEAASALRGRTAKKDVGYTAAGIESFKRIRERAGSGGGCRNGQLHRSDDFGSGAGCSGFREWKAGRKDLAAGNGEAGGGSDGDAGCVGERDGSRAGSGGTAGGGAGVIHDVDLEGFGAGDSDGREAEVSRKRGRGLRGCGSGPDRRGDEGKNGWFEEHAVNLLKNCFEAERPLGIPQSRFETGAARGVFRQGVEGLRC